MLGFAWLLWLVSFVPAVSLSARAYSAQSRKSNLLVGAFCFAFIFVLLYIIAFFLDAGLEGAFGFKTSSDDSIFLAWGLTALGLNSMLYLLFKGARKVSNVDTSYDRSRTSGFTTIVSLVGLLSSILGILSFFWDHFYKK